MSKLGGQHLRAALGAVVVAKSCFSDARDSSVPALQPVMSSTANKLEIGIVFTAILLPRWLSLHWHLLFGLATFLRHSEEHFVPVRRSSTGSSTAKPRVIDRKVCNYSIDHKLRGVPMSWSNAQGVWGESRAIAGTKPESEFLRGKMDSKRTLA